MEKIKNILQVSNDVFTWVQLLNTQAMIREGELLEHCSGDNNEPHIKDMLEGKYIFLSLRDKENIPHVTIKYNSKSKIIVDLVGKQNSKPDEKYYKYIVEIMNYLKLRPQIPSVAPYKYFSYNNNTDIWRYDK